MDTVSDSDGNTYRTVRIGNRIWMAEDLRTAFPGIPHLFPENNGKVGPLGGLYQLFSQKTGCLHEVSTLLPSGWSLPGDSELDQLAEALYCVASSSENPFQPRQGHEDSLTRPGSRFGEGVSGRPRGHTCEHFLPVG